MLKSGFVKLLVPVLFSIGLFSQAYARTIQLGALNIDASYSLDALNGGTALTQKTPFRFGELSAMGGSFIESGATDFNLSLDVVPGTAAGKRDQPWLVAGSFSFADLAPGTQAFMMAGASPAVSRNLLGVAAVPETETWLMVLIGVGLVVFQLRRTQRSLQHRPLAA